MRATRWVLAGVVLAGAGWAAGRIARGPARVDIRAFDPDEVARLETAMWRSYYDRRRLPLFGQLVALLRGQFRLAPARSLATAFLAARAAAVFQVGRGHADYQRALPDLERYYAAILAVSETPFDAARAAQLELDWWIVHREVAEQARGPKEAAHYRDVRPDRPQGSRGLGSARPPLAELERALAGLAAELYRVPAERLGVHAERRAEAMTIRDRRAQEPGGVAEADWDRIQSLLRLSWRALATELRAATPAR
jgi:hypothetical protein